MGREKFVGCISLDLSRDEDFEALAARESQVRDILGESGVAILAAIEKLGASS